MHASLRSGLPLTRPRSTALLQEALTHKSALEELTPSLRGNRRDYQRLEFLGDAALQLIISEALMRRHGAADEGELTKRRALCVRESSLAELARKYRLDRCVELGVGVRLKGGAEEAMLCDLFESVLGAVFLDGGLAKAKTAFGAALNEMIDRFATCDPMATLDPKGYVLQQADAGKIKRPVFAHVTPASLSPQLVLLTIDDRA